MESTNVIYQVNKADLLAFAKEIISDAKEIAKEEAEAQNNEKYLTPEAVEEMLSIKRTSLWKWAEKGYLNPYKVGRFNRYKESEVRALIERRAKV